jgi:predicted MPP superfamily phosphohydrolase
MERRPRLRRWSVLAAILVGIVGAWLGLTLAGRTTVPAGPFRLELSAGFGRGVTRVELPPFGELTADTHLAPLGVAASLRDVDVDRLTDVVRRDGVDGMVDGVQRDLEGSVRGFAVRLLLAAALGGAVLALLVFRRHTDLVAVAVIAAMVSISASEVLAATTYDVAAFSEPTYSGSLSQAPGLIGPVRDVSDRIESMREGLEQAVEGAVSAYTSLQVRSGLEDGGVRVLHISDLHTSPLGMDFAQQVARSFDVDLVIDTGDLTSFAAPVEELIASRIAGFGRPYVFVRGNHDTQALQSRVAGTPNGIVLDGDTTTIDGLTVYGLGHPVFAPALGYQVDDEAFAEETRAAGERILQDLDALPEPPDIVAVHDDRMAEAIAGRVPLVISGHFHKTQASVEAGTLYLRIGTTGGAGAGVFRGLEENPLVAEVLYFSPGPDPTLVAYDVIEQLPESGSLTVKRVYVAEEFGELTPSPTEAPTGPTAITGPTATAGVTEP